jgi:radical SAM protein with 4Fe4S-binding SPASM domain
VELADEIQFMQRSSGITSFPAFTPQEIIKYYSENTFIRNQCVASFYGAIIKPNGDVKLCPDEWVDDYLLGNIRENTFAEIWNNERARFFRKKIFYQKQFAGCKRCSWMYSF